MFPRFSLPRNFLFIPILILILARINECRFSRLRHIVQRFLQTGRAREIDIESESFASLGDMLTVSDTPAAGIEIRQSVWRLFDSLDFHLVENCIH